jgi:outer membrane autotransporter protein
MKKLILIAALSAYLPTAYAQTQQAGTEYYAGISIGSAKISADLDANTSEKSGTYKLFIGTNIQENVDIEAHYSDKIYELSNATGETIKASTYGVSAIYKMPQEDFTPFVKVGYHKWKSESDDNVETLGKTDGTDFLYGAGITKELDEKISFRAEVEYFKADGDSIKYYSIGVQRKF